VGDHGNAAATFNVPNDLLRVCGSGQCCHAVAEDVHLLVAREFQAGNKEKLIIRVCRTLRYVLLQFGLVERLGMIRDAREAASRCDIDRAQLGNGIFPVGVSAVKVKRALQHQLLLLTAAGNLRKKKCSQSPISGSGSSSMKLS